MSYIPPFTPAPITTAPFQFSGLPAVQPTAPFSFLPGSGGLGQLSAGGANGVLGRAAAAPGYVPQYLPRSAGLSAEFGGMSQGIGSRLANSALGGEEALGAANALRGGVGGVEAASGAGGIGARLAGLLPAAGEAAPLLTKGAMLKGGLYGVAGQVGSGLADRYTPGSHNSNLEQGLQGAAQGAGIGAGLGLLGGPFAELTVPAGAAIGGLAGGALGVLGNTFGWGGDGGEDGAKKATPEQILAHAITVAQLDAGTTDQILNTYDTMMALNEGIEDKDAREAANQQALDQVGQLVLSAIGQKDQQASNLSNMGALQAQAQRIFEPLAQDIQNSAGMYSDAMGQIRGSLPDTFRGIADFQVASNNNSATRLADAYRAQAAITPAISALTQYQQDQSSFANQQFQQMLAQQAAGSSQAQGQDVAALLAG